MRILITGGTGFIGGRLAEYLYKAGHEILIGSRNLTHSPDWLPHVKVERLDWSDLGALEKSCSGVNVVIHAAGMNAQDCASDPVAALSFNGTATARLVTAANQAKVKRFIYLSSAHIYASPLAGVINEQTCPNNKHPYATSHLAGEDSVLWGCQPGGMEGVVLRLSNVFGAPVDKNVNCWMLLVNDLCRQAALTKKMVLRTSGCQQRDFININEAFQVIEFFLVGDNFSEKIGIFNVGSGVSQSVIDMASFIQERCMHVLGFMPPIEKNEEALDEVFTPLKFEISKIQSVGYVKKPYFQNEIDSILLMCKEKFGVGA